MIMVEEVYFYEPTLGHGLAHDPFNAIIAPRPIGWISSCDDQGRCNLAPYSFFNAFNYNPPIIAFSSIGRKDTLRNVQQTGEFVWNLVTQKLVRAMNETSVSAPPTVDEFAFAGLTPLQSRVVNVPRVAESPVAFECRLSQLVQLTDASRRNIQTWLVLGEVVGVHISSSLLVDGVFDTAAAKPVLRGGGPGTYFGLSVDQRFDIERPNYPKRTT